MFTIPIYTGAVNTETSHVKDEQLGTQENNRYESVCTNILKSYEKNSPAFSSENYLVVLQNVNMSYTKTTPKDTVRVIRTIANNNPSQEAFKEIYHAVGAGKTVCFGTKKICGDENINLTNTTPEKKEISEVKKKTDEKNKASQKEKDEDEFQKLIAFTKWLKDNDGVDAVCAIETNKKSKLDNALANPFLFGTKGELAKSGFSEKDPFILAFKQGVREAKIDVLINEAETVLKETSKDPLKAIQAASSSQQATAILSGHQEKIEKLTKINAKLQLLLGSLAPQERKDILTKERSNINNEIELQITTATTDQREFRKAIQSKKAAEEKPYAALKTELEENLKILSDLLVLSGEVAIPTLENAKNELEKTVNKITPLLKKDKAVSEAKGLSLEKITKVKKELIKAEVLLSVLHLTDNLIAMKGDANKLPEMQNLITTAPDIIANAKNILGENSDIVTAAEGVLVECRKEIQRSAAEENETLSRQANITEEQAEFDKLTQLRASSAAQAKLQESQHEESTKLTQSELENRDKIKKEFDLSQQETQGRKKIVGEGDAELAALGKTFTEGEQKIEGAALESEEKTTRELLHAQFKEDAQQAERVVQTRVKHEQEEYASLLEIRIRSVELAVNNLDSAVVNATNNVSVINTLDDGYFNAVDAVTRARNQLQDAYDGAIAILGSNASIIVRASEILINANKRLVIAEEEITRIAIQQEARPKLRKIKTERVEEFNKLTQAKLQKSQLGESTELTQSESKERQLLHTEFMKKTQQAQQLDLSRRETQDRKAIDDEGEAELITLQEAFTRREQEIKEKSEALQKEFKEQYTVFDANITNAIAILNAAVSYAALIKLREELETMRKRSAQDADGLSKEAATELTEIHGRLSTQVEGGAQDKKIQTEKAEQALHTINTTLVDANTALQDVIEIDEKDITKLEKQLPISQQILTTATTDLTEARKNVLPTHDDIAQANNQLAALQNKINEMTVIISQVKELQKNIDDALAAATQLQKNLTT